MSFRQPWTFLCTCICTCVGACLCNAEKDTIWTHFKTHRPGPWAPSTYISVITEWHDKPLKNRNLQIRCAEVNSVSQFCWHGKTQEEGWASERRHQQNSKNIWRIALDLTPLSSHFMHWDAFQNYHFAHFLHHKTYERLLPGLKRERSQALSLIPRCERRLSWRRASHLQM